MGVDNQSIMRGGILCVEKKIPHGICVPKDASCCCQISLLLVKALLFIFLCLDLESQT